jgi:tetratricopeptide (TPR) repeat protein
MTTWRTHFQASRLVGRKDFAAAGRLYEKVLASDPRDAWAAQMLAVCYEQEGRNHEALRAAENAVALSPDSLIALQTASRLAIGSLDHAKAARYVSLALALPEVEQETPRAVAPRFLLRLVRLIAWLPGLRHRLRQSDLDEIDLPAQTMELRKWKHWAYDYLAWQSGGDPGNHGPVAH